MDSVIHTDRLNLRYVTANDIDDIQRCICDPRIYEMVARTPPEQPRDATEDWVSTHKDGRDARTDYVYAIRRKHEFIGLIGLHRAAVSDPFEIGFWMSPQAWGQGYVTEAGKAVLQNLDDNLGPQKTLSGYFADNPASGRVLEKLGYVQTSKGELFCAGRNKVLPHIALERNTAANRKA